MTGRECDARHVAGARERGFSLVELAVTVAVMAVFAMAAAPSLFRVMPRLRLDSAAGQLVDEIALCRRSAIEQSTDYRIRFDIAGEAYTLEKRVVAAAGPPVVYGWAGLGRTTLPGTDIESVTGFAQAGTLVVLADGTVNVPLSQAGRITLATPDGSSRRRVVLEPLGRILVQSWKGGASWADR